MSELCLRCDWEGEAPAPRCPRCAAPLYRSRPSESAQRRARAIQPPPDVPSTDRGGAAGDDEAMTAAVEPLRSPASARSAVGVVAVTFAVVALLLARGATERREPSIAPSTSASPSPAGLPNGILVYAAPAGEGASRLWRWDLSKQVVRRGPLIPRPEALVNVASPGYGWIGLTAARPGATQEAALLDALGPAARAERIGTADLVTWTRGGGSVVLVDHGAPTDGCRHDVLVTVIHLDSEGSEIVLDRPVCGDVAAVGRTSLGYFAGLVTPDRADIVGLGYSDAGVLLEHHRLLGISPGGEMLVSSTASGGSALAFQQFRGAPVPYVAGGAPLSIDRVLAYGPGSIEALVVGRAGTRPAAVWSLPLRHDDRRSIEATRLLASGGRPVWAAYTSNGTAFVLRGSRLSILRNGRLSAVEPPRDAPAPNGPIVWILREPLTEL